MPRIYWKLEQGTADWYRVRMGIPTASEFDQIITPSKGDLSASRKKYACQLIAERLLKWQADSLEKIKHVADGKAHEPLAIGQLHALTEISTHRIGFVTTDDGRFGASPDRAIGGNPAIPGGVENGTLGITIEAKCPTIPKQIEYLLLGHGPAYRCQVQGQLYVAQADKAIFFSFNEHTPEYMVETGRDEPFIRKIADGLEQFSDELEEMTERARSLGVWQAFAEIRTPVDNEYGHQLRTAPMETAEELAALVEGAAGDRLSWGG